MQETPIKCSCISKLLKNEFILRNTAAETGQSGSSQNSDETGLQLKLKLIQLIGVQREIGCLLHLWYLLGFFPAVYIGSVGEMVMRGMEITMLLLWSLIHQRIWHRPIKCTAFFWNGSK